MSVKIVVGGQWGDEGKGKIVDYLSQNMDLIVRYQGGDNAGHTVVNELGEFKLHLIPCGIFYPGCHVLAGTGMVINPDELLKEIGEVEQKGVDTSRLHVSGKATILMPYHVALDNVFEKAKGSIGSTKRGIAYAYADRARRIALRMEDLLDLDYALRRLQLIIPTVNKELAAFGAQEVTVDEIFAKCKVWAEKLGKRIVEPVSFIHKALDQNKNIMFEGQLGAMKDLDLGIYPYVTSSNPVAAYACASAGVPISKVDDVVGVIKAFSSAVGGGPFPTEMGDDEADAFRGTGEHVDDEFGARTGRARRLGWLDLPIVRYGAQINGYTELAICKIDKLDKVERLKVCVGYKLDGKDIDFMPSSKDLDRVIPVYEEMDGWLCDTTKIRKIEDLPLNAKKYIAKIEDYCGVKVRYVGVGPDRDSIAR